MTVVISPVDQWTSILLMTLYPSRPKWAICTSKKWNPPLDYLAELMPFCFGTAPEWIKLLISPLREFDPRKHPIGVL